MSEGGIEAGRAKSQEGIAVVAKRCGRVVSRGVGDGERKGFVKAESVGGAGNFFRA